MMFLGGSLFQVMLPFMLAGAFLIINKDGFAASVCLWWTGQSLMDLAPYIGDARALRLPLLGGGTGADVPGMHDWANILRRLGWLDYDQQIASGVNLVGSCHNNCLAVGRFNAENLLPEFRFCKQVVTEYGMEFG